MRIVVLCFCFLTILKINAQDDVNIKFCPKINLEELTLDSTYKIGGSEVVIRNFKFYMTDLCFYDNDSIVYSDEKAYLIDLLNSNSLKIIEKPLSNYNKIKFKIGVDSITSVSGVFDGDLDPTKGMYWTWQSGYINFKIEGSSPLCPTRNNKFSLHIGGYMNPFNSQREVVLETFPDKDVLVNIQLNLLFETIDLSKKHTVMSPGKLALDIADVLPSIFVIQD